VVLGLRENGHLDREELRNAALCQGLDDGLGDAQAGDGELVAIGHGVVVHTENLGGVVV
jgi:hypothetical protein